MAKNTHGFSRRVGTQHRSKYAAGGKSREISAETADAIPVYVSEDGKVYARGYVDTNDNLELYVRQGKIIGKFLIDDRFGLDKVEVRLSDSENTEYHAEKEVTAVVTSNFGHYQKALTVYKIESTEKYHTSPRHRSDKMKILSQQNANVVFDYERASFTGNNGKVGVKFPDTYKRPTILRPFTVDMILKPENINSINDLMVIKTGEYATGDNGLLAGGKGGGMGREEIVWVSPHRMINSEAWVVKDLWVNAKGSSGYIGKGYWTGISYLSSKDYTIDNNQGISGGLHWSHTTGQYTEYGAGIGGLAGSVQTTLQDTDFYNFYEDQQSKCKVGTWDGVIPANTPFKIEYWTHNGDLEGFNGRAIFVPIIDEIVG